MNQTQINAAQQPGGTKLVLVAAVLAVLSVVLVNTYIHLDRNRREDEAFTVYTLSVPVSPGDRLRKQDVKAWSVPRKFREAFDALGIMEPAGMQLRLENKEPFMQSANAGELLTYRLFTLQEGQDIDSKITPGMRLVELPINSRRIPGPLRVGMYVDIAGTFQTDQGTTIQPVMERVKVIALGSRSAFDNTDGRSSLAQRSFQTLTIQVRPEQALELAMIEKIVVGDFELYMRNPGDTGTHKLEDGAVNKTLVELAKARLRQGLPVKR
jgi:Flp pilus assembly protein CpaB